MNEVQLSVAEQTLISLETRSWLDRWFDAMTDARSVAAQSGHITQWRVMVGEIGVHDEGPLDSAPLAMCAERCRAIGGEFNCVLLDATESQERADCRLAELGDE